MHHTVPVGGQPLDSSGAAGPRLELTPYRTTREEDGPWDGPRVDSDHTTVTTVAGPTLRGLTPSGQQDGMQSTDNAVAPPAMRGRTAVRRPSGPGDRTDA
jgi:hypothetical protein